MPSDMEAKAREAHTKGVRQHLGLRGKCALIACDICEAHREGMEAGRKNPDKETRIRIYAVGRGDWLEYKQQLINRGMEEERRKYVDATVGDVLRNEGMEEAAKVAENMCVCSPTLYTKCRSCRTAAAIREKIKGDDGA